MKKIFKYFGIFLSIALMGAATACNPQEIENPDDLGLGIKVFFPTKVVTGQPMTINGSGFAGVREIVFPNGVSVTDFELVSGEMIRVNAPSGIASEGGKIIVRTANDEAESRLPLTIGHTVVSGFSKQEGESISGGEQLTIYGEDLEFLSGIELLDPDGNPYTLTDKDFYRKGTNNTVITIPLKNIYTGKFVGRLFTIDGQVISLPELSYEPAADNGHWETVKTTIWKNDGSLGAINWDSNYRFAPESNSTGEECYTVPQATWDQMKAGSFYMLAQGSDWVQMRITTGWWSTTWTGDDICTGNERIIDNGDGTFVIELNFAGDPILDLLDAQHLLLTGGGYTPLELYFAEDVWVDGGGTEIVEVPVWENDGSHGTISWSGDYRFAPESNSTGEEIYTVPQDVWNRMKSETFYIRVKDDGGMQIRVTTGWWSVTWTGNDLFAGDERIKDNGDGTYDLEVNLSGDEILDLLDAQHLLFTGAGYTPLKIFFLEEHQSSGGDKPTVFWKNDAGSAVSWSGYYRFALEGHDGLSECCAEFPQDVWDWIKTKTFYLKVTATDPQIRVTTGWWDPSWKVGDIQPGNELLTDNGDGTFTVEINLADDPDFTGALDERHLLFTGDRFTPVELFYYNK